MNAPAKAADLAAASFRDIAVDQIIVSKTLMQVHRRASFDKEALQLLADNVRQVGVIQPVLVRPLSGTDKVFELVAGERRFIAAGMAKLKTIPAMVRELSDLEALELQVIENKQREGLHELIEAEGFEEMMKKHKLTADQIADKIGMGRRYVYNRLKLLELCPEVRTAFLGGKVNYSIAMLIARCPVHDLQRQALKEVSTPRFPGEEPMSTRRAAEHMQQNYMLRLDQAPFKTADEKLLPKAGPCGPCPKRTGNQVDLFPDVKSADTCTDPQCFSAKKAAHMEQQRKAAEARGLTVISGKQAKELFPYQHSSRPSGYVLADDQCYAVSQPAKFSKLLGKDAPPVTVIENPHTGALIEAWPEAEVNKILRAKKIIKPAKKPKASKAKSAAPTVNVDEVINQRLFMAVRPKFTSLDVSELREVAKAYVECTDGADDAVLCKLWGWKDKDANYFAIEKKISALGEAEISRLLFDLMILDELEYSNHKPEKLLAAAKRYKVDVDKIKTEVKAELKAAADAPKAPAVLLGKAKKK
jgi:ParB/RepB/Spo0J family partition protein